MRTRKWYSALPVLVFVLAFVSASAQEPTTLSRIIVTAQQKRCPVADDAVAHTFWDAMAAHYSPVLPLIARTSWFARDGAHAEGSVQNEDIGSFDAAESAARSGGGVRNSLHGVLLSGPSSTAAKGRMSRNEYADRIPDDEPRLLYQPVYLNWYYTRLDELFLDHFVDTAFEKHHDFALVSLPSRTVLAFCGRDHSKPWIEGTMEITPDSLISYIALQYVTPKPKEDAAAEIWIDLDASVGPTGRHLWPERSIFYRRSSRPNVWFQSAWMNVVTCIWNDPESALAGREPDLFSRKKGCTKANPR